MKVFTIIVDEELVNSLQRLSFEMEGQKRIIKELILENESNPDFLENKAFKSYNEKYEETVAAYEIGKQEIQNLFVPKMLRESPLASWNLDFGTNVMTISYKGTDLDNITEEQVKELFNGKTA